MRRQLPTWLEFDGVPWRIYYSKRRPPWVKQDPGESLCGYSDPAGNRVWIQKTDQPVEDIQTLVHESDHIINMYAGARSEKVTELVESKLEESLVSARESIFWRFLRDNDLSWVLRRKDTK